MRAAIFHAFNEALKIETVPDPAPPADGVVVRVEACGICRSDLHGWVGTDPDVVLPHVPGHEFAGTVEAVGPDCRRWKAGDRVVAPFIIACGQCPACRSGDPTVCPDQYVPGFTGWGAFAEFIALPRADFNLERLPEASNPVEAAGMGCRFTTAYRGLVERAGLGPGEWLAVHGCGGVGLSAVMLGAALGASVLAVDIGDEKLALARELGANATLNARDSNDVAEAVLDITGGGAHVSVDALGVSETMRNSVLSLRPLGRHVQIGMPAGAHVAPAMPMDVVYRRQLSLLGSRGVAAHRLPGIFEMVAAGRVEPGRMVTRRVSLEEAGDVLADMREFKGLGVAVIDRF
ncbi:MAG: zinc-dependent alcohol dehydrogenase family protein [Rhodovibrionaceae bacterium]|nr:zinc-dependent alcohol dehydrogenase family protein [Rhodovibrionaceae bacterium]